MNVWTPEPGNSIHISSDDSTITLYSDHEIYGHKCSSALEYISLPSSLSRLVILSASSYDDNLIMSPHDLNIASGWHIMATVDTNIDSQLGLSPELHAIVCDTISNVLGHTDSSIVATLCSGLRARFSVVNDDFLAIDGSIMPPRMQRERSSQWHSVYAHIDVVAELLHPSPPLQSGWTEVIRWSADLPLKVCQSLRTSAGAKVLFPLGASRDEQKLRVWNQGIEVDYNLYDGTKVGTRPIERDVTKKTSFIYTFQRRITGKGLHRFLVTEGSFPSRALLIDMLPRDVYLDSDELAVSVMSSPCPYWGVYQPMDVEMPASRAMPHLSSTYLCDNIANTINVTTPVHMRYQRAVANDGTVRSFSIPAPLLFTAEGSKDNRWLPLKSNTYSSGSKNFGDWSNPWWPAEPVSLPSGFLSALGVVVPAGNVTLAPFVTWATLAIATVIAAILTTVVLTRNRDVYRWANLFIAVLCCGVLVAILYLSLLQQL